MDFSLPDKDFQNLKTDIKDFSMIDIKLDGFENLNGKITFVDTKLDEETSTIKVRAQFDNKDGLLTPGMFVRVYLKIVTSKSLIKIPQKAILQNPNETICFVLDNDTVGVRPVQLVESKDDYFFVKGSLNRATW